MGLGDKLKDLRKQAQDAVVEHNDQIQDAMGVAGAAVDRKTHGKYTAKIANLGQKASDAVDKLGDPGEGAEGGDAGKPQGGEPQGGEPQGGEPQGGEPQGGEPQGGEPQRAS